MSSTTEDFHDPRTDGIDYEVKEGQVYGDTRHKPEDGEDWPEKGVYRLVYVDEHVVLMKSNEWTERTNQRLYRQETRATFEDNAGAGRYKLLDESTHAPPMPDDLQEVRSLISRLHDHYAKQGTRVGNHKAEAFEELSDKLEQFEAKEIDLTAVSGVGEGTADNLREAGYSTDMDIRAAEVEDLVAVRGVGEKVAERLKDRAS